MAQLDTARLNADVYQDQHIELDFSKTVLRVDGKEVGLTRKELELLSLMARNAGEIMARAMLLFRVWGYGKDIRTRTLDVHIRRLRKKLAPYGEVYIETIFGVGYRFQPYRPSRPFQLYPAALAAAV